MRQIALLLLLLVPGRLMLGQMNPMPCPSVIPLSNFTYSHYVAGLGAVTLKLQAPHVSVGPVSQLVNTATYTPGSIYVPWRGSRKPVATGNWLGSCWNLETPPAVFLLAKVDAFLGTVTQPPSDNNDGVCEVGAQGEALREGDDVAESRASTSRLEDADCVEWEYSVEQGTGGGGGTGPTWTCYTVDWYDVYTDGSWEYVGSTTLCYEGYAE
ncbi:MAG: hypothetical protein NTW72_09760 [Gemmatimonadetes bacterium]|nr:hypothetical protein [Gemmatimonadota bacterium]